MADQQMGAPSGNGRYPHLRTRWRPFPAKLREVPLSASYAQRAGASLFDGVLFLCTVPIPLEVAFFIVSYEVSAARSRLLFWGGAAFFTLVYSWFVSRRRSVGQLAVGMAVIAADGSRAGYPSVVLRTVVKLLGFAGWAYVWAAINWGAPPVLVVGLAPFGVGLLWPLWDRRSRAWHDIVSSTRAISV